MRLPPREQLAINLSETSKAYGYTLCIWGSGAVLIRAYQLPTTMQVMLYIVGAVLGFGALALLVYGALAQEIERFEEQKVLAATMIHLVAAPVTVILTYFITLVTAPDWGFLLAGVNATASYNVMLLIESVVYEELIETEQWIEHLVRQHV